MSQQLYYKNIAIELQQACALPAGYFEDEYLEAALQICREWLDINIQSFVIHSSGSTGTPKSISLSRNQIRASALATIDFLQLRHGTHALVCLPTAHIGGQMMLIRALEAGLHIWLEKPSSLPLQSFEKLPNEGFSIAAFVPLQWDNIIKNIALTIRAFGQAAGVLLGGAPLSPTLERACQSFDFPIWHTYGMSETVSHIALRQLAPIAQAAFRLLPGIEAYSDATTGMLHICGPQTQNQWLNTNDIAYWIDNQNFVWQGRADRVINSGGIKISPEKIEKIVLELLPFVSECLVLPLDDARLGQKAVGVLQTSKPDTAELYGQYQQFIITLKDKLPKYNLPTQWFFLDSFPVLQSGKIDMLAIRLKVVEMEENQEYIRF